MRKTLVPSGWLSRAKQTVPILAVAGFIWGSMSCVSASAETYYGMSVVKTVSGYKVVDIRPVLSKLRYVNDRAKSTFGLVRTSTPLYDVSIGGWKTLTLTANQLSVSGGRNVPAGSKYFLFYPRVSSSMWAVGALYYANGAWNAAMIGASRENKCDHFYDFGTQYSSAGAFFHGWCLPWSKSYPTVVLMMDSSKATYGVLLNASVPAPTYPAAPANTYTLIQSSLTWSEAKADAERRGGHLATITSPTEWSNVLKQAGSTLLNQNLWLGGTDEGSEGTWRWVTGETWLYTRWTEGQPNNASYRQHYLQLWGATGSAYTWDDQENATLPGYLLETSGVTYPAAPAGHVYRLVNASLTWTQAKTAAEQLGGYLATITSPAEWANVVSQVGSANLQGKEIWLGATDAAGEGTWRWVTGESWLYTRWASGQPNNSGGSQHYLHLMASTGANLQWDDMQNSAIPYYLLELPPGGGEPVPTPAIQTSATQVNVPEGRTAAFSVKLSTAPAAARTVTVARASGDADLRVSGGASLVFTPANFGTWQTVTLAAAEDGDTANGSATIQCAASGCTAATLTATEQDNDLPPSAGKINCGGGALAGGWTADTGFVGGGTFATASSVANATLAPVALYQSDRNAPSFRYSFGTLPNGPYRVRLHFCELLARGAGQRVFHVAIEGARVLSNLDIYAAAGGRLRALAREFEVTVADGNGLQLDFTRVLGYAQICGIEIESLAPAAPEPEPNSYVLISSSLTWTEAQADAVKRGGYLATVTSEAEWTEILSQVGAANLQNKEVWLGGSDAAQEGTWQWVTGEAWAYARWAGGQPNNVSANQHYLHLWAATGANFQWDDMENSALPYYLLEVPAASGARKRAVDVLASSGEAPYDDPWSLVDQDSDTLWMGRTDAGGWWVVMVYPFPVDVAAVRLGWAEALAADRVQALWSLDAKTWTSLAEDEPPLLRYLWLIFEDDGSGVPPAIRSIDLE